MLEKHLIEHCSPTLASIKTANLFTCAYGDEAELEREVTDWNRQMRGKGIFLQVLRKKEGRALVYVCRFSRLEEDMQKPGTAEFLKQCGYEKAEPAAALDRLRRKLQSEDGFPHEIGLLLGYPLGDVVGFIVNAGRNYALTGYWKVYTNAGETARMFERYNRCRDVYERLWKQGRSVSQLTVAA